MKPDLSIYQRVFFDHKFMEDYILSYAGKGIQALLTVSEFKKDREVKAAAFMLYFRYCGMTRQEIGQRYGVSGQYVANLISEFNRKKPRIYYEILDSLKDKMADKQIERTETSVSYANTL
jgi:hypothetical protein